MEKNKNSRNVMVLLLSLYVVEGSQLELAPRTIAAFMHSSENFISHFRKYKWGIFFTSWTKKFFFWYGDRVLFCL